MKERKDGDVEGEGRGGKNVCDEDVRGGVRSELC